MIEAGAILKNKVNDKLVVVTAVEEDDGVVLFHTIDEDLYVDKMACMAENIDSILEDLRDLEFVKQSTPTEAVRALFGCGETVLKEI